MRVRELRTELQRLSCCRLRCKGSHETWRTPAGVRLPPLKINHRGADVSRAMLNTYRRILTREGLYPPF